MRILTLLALPIFLSTCMDRLLFEPAEGFAHHEPDARYEALFPYYVELCASSQFRPLDRSEGGIPGHAVMYLKGACVDGDAPYPQLRHCQRNATDLADPEHGAGISVNRWFRNVNWMGVRSHAQFFGDPGAGGVVTQERLDAAVRAVVDAGSFDGIELWPYPSQTESSTILDFATRHSAGTDFAIRYARSSLCGRVPVEPAQMDEIIHFLNDLNRKFATGVVDYVWSGFSDNCVHTLRNSLAAASIDEPISVRTAKLLQVFNLAVPANEAIQLAALGTTGPLDSLPSIFRSDPMRNALLEFGWLPTRHGALLVSLPVFAENEIFDPQARIAVFQGPMTKRTTLRLLAMLDDPRFTDLDPNLAHFEQVYRDILASPDRSTEALSAVRGDRFRRVRRRYYSVIETALKEVEKMRAGLAAAPVAAQPGP